MAAFEGHHRTDLMVTFEGHHKIDLMATFEGQAGRTRERSRDRSHPFA